MVKNVQIKSAQWVTARAETGRGTFVCLLPPFLARQAGLEEPLRTYRVSLENGGTRRMKGDLGLVKIGSEETSSVLMVCDDIEKPLLGMEALEHLGAKTWMPRGKLRASPGGG